MINIEDFKKIDLRIGTILEVSRVEGSDKLLKLRVDLGGEVENSPRQIVSGIGKFYTPEDLIKKQVIVIANLEPKTIFNLESHGMLLATNSNEKVIILKPAKKAKPGSKVS